MHKWLTIALLAAPAVAYAQTDVGLVNLAAGDVAYTSQSGPRAKVTPFMKVREGDRFTLGAGAQLRVLYFQSGRQERFTGPASFTAGRQAGSAHSGSQPQVTSLPTGVPQRIARIPELLQNVKLGGVQLRGNRPPAKPDDANLREARALYERLRKELPKDDITPELFLYSTLSDYHRHDDMRPVVDEMLRKQPDNEEVKALAAWVRSQPRRVK